MTEPGLTAIIARQLGGGLVGQALATDVLTALLALDPPLLIGGGQVREPFGSSFPLDADCNSESFHFMVAPVAEEPPADQPCPTCGGEREERRIVDDGQVAGLCVDVFHNTGKVAEEPPARAKGLMRARFGDDGTCEVTVTEEPPADDLTTITDHELCRRAAFAGPDELARLTAEMSKRVTPPARPCPSCADEPNGWRTSICTDCGGTGRVAAEGDTDD